MKTTILIMTFVFIFGISVGFLFQEIWSGVLVKGNTITYQEAPEAPITEPQQAMGPEVAQLPIGGMETAIAPFLSMPISKEEFIDYSSPYGLRKSPFTGELANHGGVDMYGVWHCQIKAAAGGRIISHWPPPSQVYSGHPQLGGFIKIMHADGSETWYGHMSETYIHEGDIVEQGQVIGRQGRTGITTGGHLHFELWLAGVRTNPLKYIIAD